MTSHVVMFSSGAGSAAAAKRVADRHGTQHLTLLFADVNGEHEDNYRFLDEAARWIGGDLVTLDNNGRTIWDVFRESRFLGNTRADVCSRVLKREPLRKWLNDNCDPTDTIVYLGFDWTEEHRLIRSKEHWSPWSVDCPLMWAPMHDKSQALDTLHYHGIEPPLLTRRGFPHANCGGGCVKAGIGQFRRLLALDPDRYTEWETREQEIRVHIGKDVAILRDRRGGVTKPLTLAELRTRIGDEPSAFKNEPIGGCNCMVPTDDEGEVMPSAR